MDYSSHLLLLILCSKCIAVNIKRIDVPKLVEVGTEAVILDCEFITSATPDDGLVIKWFFNSTSGLVYQWIPPQKPQAIGLLKGKVDLNFQISDEPLQAYRAIKIIKPTTDLSGNYTCVASTFKNEDSRTKPMLVYSSGKNFSFYQEKKYVFIVTLICSAEDLYPRPEMQILAKGKPLSEVLTNITMNSWGLYSMTTTAVVYDDDVSKPSEEFVCVLNLPQAQYTANRTTIYYPGLIPTAYIAAVEMEKHQTRRASNGLRLSSPTPFVFHIVLPIFFLF